MKEMNLATRGEKKKKKGEEKTNKKSKTKKEFQDMV